MKIRKLDTSNLYNRNNGYNLAPKLIIGCRLISSRVGIMMSMNDILHRICSTSTCNVERPNASMSMSFFILHLIESINKQIVLQDYRS